MLVFLGNDISDVWLGIEMCESACVTDAAGVSAVFIFSIKLCGDVRLAIE